METSSSRYTQLRSLGSGGMAVVYEVLDRATGRHMALKRPQANDNPERAQRTRELFAREYHTLAQLAHPRVVEVYDYGVDDQGPFYTMELLDGGDLERLLRREPRRVCGMARDVCSALSLLHSRRVVHRDISPRNVRCNGDGLAKLIDFGAMARMGVAKELVGTPVYCAPEVLHMQPLDGRADLYALGATLYYVLTGHHAYPARDFASLQHAWEFGVARPSELVPGLPAGLEELVLDLLQLDAAKRPSTAAEVIDRLSGIEGRTIQEEHLQIAQSYLQTPMFVGREPELARLRSKALRARSGHGGTLLIRGNAGIGRSRFLDQNVLAAKLLGLTVVRADADDAAHGEYGIVRRILQQLEQQLPAQVGSLVQGDLPLLRRVFPQLLGGQDVGSQLDADDLSRHQLQDALLRLFRGLCERTPLLVAIDDLSAADESSLATLGILAREAQRTRLLLLCTAETGVVARAAVPFELLAEVAGELALHSLSLSEAQSLLASMFGASRELEALTTRLHALAAGSPRDLMRLAQHLVEQGIIRYQHGAWSLPTRLGSVELPSSIAQLLSARVASLDSGALDLACALALSTDVGFRFDECSALSKLSPAEVMAALVRLEGLDVVRKQEDDDRYALADHAWVALLCSLRSPSELSELHLRLAGVFERRTQEHFRRAQHLLRAGRTEQALALLVAHSIASRHQTDLDPQVFFDFVRSQPLDWRETYEEALAACRALERPIIDEHALRMRLGGLLAIGLPGRSPLPETVARLARDCGIDAWAQLDAAMPPGERLKAALARARSRYADLPEHERLLDPAASIKELTVAIRYTTATAARGFDVDQMRALPSLAPFAALAPVLSVVEMLRRGVLARMTGRIDEACQLYADLLQKIAAPGHNGLNETAYTYMHLMVLSTLALIEAGLGRASGIEHLPEIEQHPLFTLNAMQLRMQHHLWQGETQAALHCREQLSVLRLQNSSQQSFESGNLIWQLLAHVANEDLRQLKHALAEVTQFAAQYPGWQPVQVLGRAEYLRLCGDHARALKLLRSCLDAVQAGDHQLWVQLAAAEIRALDLAGRSAEAAARGAQHLADHDAAQLGVSSRQYLLIPLAVAQARSQHPDAISSAQAALHYVEERAISGINRLLSLECRARVALLLRDRAGFERYVELCERCYEHSNAVQTAKLQKLRREAQLLHLVPDSPLSGQALHVGVGETVFKSRVTSCADADERALTMLEWLVRQSGALGGWLFVVTGHGQPLRLAASLHEHQPSTLVQETAQQYIDVELTAHALSTDADGAATTMSWSKPDEPRYRPVLLSHYVDAGYVITGLAVLRQREDQTLIHPGEAATGASRLLHEIGDISGLALTDFE